MIKVTLGIILVGVSLFFAGSPVYGEYSSREDTLEYADSVESNKVKEKAILEALEEAKRILVAKAQIDRDPAQEVVAQDTSIKLEAENYQEPRREIQTEPKRAGSRIFYPSGGGYKITPSLGVAVRTEIFAEPNPVDDYITKAKQLDRRTESGQRDMLTPLFTRAYAGQATFDYKDWPRLTYTFDKRTVLHEFESLYGIKDQNWQTNEFSFLKSLPRLKYIGVLTLNPVYKRIRLSSHDDPFTAENRNEYMLNFTITPMDTLEIFGQADYYKGKKVETPWISKPEQRLYRVEFRKDFPRYRLKIIPGYSYSNVDYKPSFDTYTKQEIYLSMGKNFTDKLRSYSKMQLVLGKSVWPGKGPSNVDAHVINSENKLSYELIKNIDISGGLNYSHGVGFSAFDNYSLVGEMQYFKPEILRCTWGCIHTEYFNLHKGMSFLYFKIYLFM